MTYFYLTSNQHIFLYRNNKNNIHEIINLDSILDLCIDLDTRNLAIVMKPLSGL